MLDHGHLQLILNTPAHFPDVLKIFHPSVELAWPRHRRECLGTTSYTKTNLAWACAYIRFRVFHSTAHIQRRWFRGRAERMRQEVAAAFNGPFARNYDRDVAY
jgi:hypothetical protein